MKRLKRTTNAHAERIEIGTEVIGSSTGRTAVFIVDRIRYHEATGTTLVGGEVDGKHVSYTLDCVRLAPKPVALPADYPAV